MNWISALIGAGAALVVVVLIVAVLAGLATIGGLRTKVSALQADGTDKNNTIATLVDRLKKGMTPFVVHFTDEQALAMANVIRNACITLHESEHGPKQ